LRLLAGRALSLSESHWKVGWQGGEIAADLSSNLGGWFDDAFDWWLMRNEPGR